MTTLLVPSWLQQTYSDFFHLPGDPSYDPSLPGCLWDQGLHTRQGVPAPLVSSAPVRVVTTPVSCQTRSVQWSPTASSVSYSPRHLSMSRIFTVSSSFALNPSPPLESPPSLCDSRASDLQLPSLSRPVTEPSRAFPDLVGDVLVPPKSCWTPLPPSQLRCELQ